MGLLVYCRSQACSLLKFASALPSQWRQTTELIATGGIVVIMSAQLESLIRSDLHRYYGRSDFETLVKCYFLVPGFRYTFHMRKAAYHRVRGGVCHKLAFLFQKVFLLRCRYRFGFQIPELTVIGRGLYIGHFGTVVINSQAVLGNDINLSPGIVVGQANRGRRTGAPTIGNRVWIGSNAVIVGKIHVGDGSVIAPGAFVNFDVPENSVVVGNPGEVHSHLGSEGYICNLAPC